MKARRKRLADFQIFRGIRWVLDPYQRYRYALYIHAGRIVIGVLASILLTTGIDLPHGEWATVTMLVVIGGLQHHGHIGKKSRERAVRTLIGASMGLVLVAQQKHIGSPLLTYLLMALMCGFFSYHAVGKGGYTALLSAVTLVIVVGHGDNPTADALWRTVDILIGVGLALAFSFALPLYAVYSWRFSLAAVMRKCAMAYAHIEGGRIISLEEHLKAAAEGNAAMLKLRSLLSSISQETKILPIQLETIQGHLRMCLSILEILCNTRPLRRQQVLLSVQGRYISRRLISMARAVQYGSSIRLKPLGGPDEGAPISDLTASSMLVGRELLTSQLQNTVEQLHALLIKTAPSWHI